MSKARVPILVFDLETGGLDPNVAPAVEVAGKVYDGQTFEPIPDGEFCSLMKPPDFSKLEPRAMECNKIKIADLERAPDQKVVWNNFVAWVNRWNKGKTAWTAPICAGKNIRAFDLRFVEVLNRLHCPKKEKTVLFNCRRQIDLEDFIYYWRLAEDMPNEKMESLRDYFGMSHEGAHSALVDVRQEGELVMKFMRLFDRLLAHTISDGKPLITFKDACKRKVCPA